MKQMVEVSYSTDFYTEKGVGGFNPSVPPQGGAGLSAAKLQTAAGR